MFTNIMSFLSAWIEAKKKSNERKKDAVVVSCLIFIMGTLMSALLFYMRKQKQGD